MKQDIIDKLTYFDVFDHPLKKTEIRYYLKENQNIELIHSEIDELRQRNVIFEFDGFLSINEHPEDKIKQRIAHEDRAKKYFRKVKFMRKLMKHFPYVRAVAISGGLSKGVIHKNGDVDYFIICKAGRLWVCRTLLILFKKIFLFNSRKYFCVNYFVDNQHLIINDQNIFVATEIATLIPVFNTKLIREFQTQNKWIGKYYSTYKTPYTYNELSYKSFLRSFGEFLMNGRWGSWLEKKFKRVTLKHWKKKYSYFDEEKFELCMRSTEGVSKHHPQDFQNKVLDSFAKKEKRESYKLQ